MSRQHWKIVILHYSREAFYLVIGGQLGVIPIILVTVWGSEYDYPCFLKSFLFQVHSHWTKLGILT